MIRSCWCALAAALPRAARSGPAARLSRPLRRRTAGDAAGDGLRRPLRAGRRLPARARMRRRRAAVRRGARRRGAGRVPPTRRGSASCSARTGSRLTRCASVRRRTTCGSASISAPERVLDESWSGAARAPGRRPPSRCAGCATIRSAPTRSTRRRPMRPIRGSIVASELRSRGGHRRALHRRAVRGRGWPSCASRASTARSRRRRPSSRPASSRTMCT